MGGEEVWTGVGEEVWTGGVWTGVTAIQTCTIWNTIYKQTRFESGSIQSWLGVIAQYQLRTNVSSASHLINTALMQYLVESIFSI